jgi:hypothetical protein
MYLGEAMYRPGLLRSQDMRPVGWCSREREGVGQGFVCGNLFSISHHFSSTDSYSYRLTLSMKLPHLVGLRQEDGARQGMLERATQAIC